MRRRESDRESFFRSLAWAAGDDEKTALLCRFGRERGWLDAKGHPTVETPRGEAPHARINEQLRRAAGGCVIPSPGEVKLDAAMRREPS